MFFAQSCYNKNMSAKDAPGEVNKNPNFDSPNITSAADEVMEMIDAEKAARKKAETVEIDGVPIDEKEVKFKAEDIKKKGKTEYFVNVEGAEQRKREAQRRAKLEAEEVKRRAKADDERVINELHKKAEQRKRENRAAEEKAKAEDTRVINELHKKAEQRKRENRAAAQREKQRIRNEKRHKKAEQREKRRAHNKEVRAKIKNFLFGKWHKYVTITIIALAILIPSGIFTVNYIQNENARKEAEKEQAIADLHDEVIDLLEDNGNDHQDEVLDKLIEKDEIEQSISSAIDVMNYAYKYEKMSLFSEYKQKCVDRGGCADDMEGKG